MSAINSISSADIAASAAKNLNSTTSVVGGSENGEGGGTFADILKDALSAEESTSRSSNVDTLNLLTGQTDNLSDVVISAQKSELALSLTVQLRNKAMDAYKEIMNMQV